MEFRYGVTKSGSIVLGGTMNDWYLIWMIDGEGIVYTTICKDKKDLGNFILNLDKKYTVKTIDTIKNSLEANEFLTKTDLELGKGD